MRTSSRAALALTVVCCTGIGGAACGGDDTSAANDSDAATDATSPGSDSGPASDSGPSDGGITPNVTVVALSSSGKPFPGAIVVFYAPDGTPAPPLRTSGDGTVRAFVASGSSVTISERIDIELFQHAFTTFLEIQPGDTLIAVPGLDPGAHFGGGGTVTIAPPDAAVSTTASWSDGCQFHTFSGEIDLAVHAECLDGGLDDGSLDVLGLALVSGGLAIASTERVGVPYVDGGTISMPDWTAISSSAVPATGAPAGTAQGYSFDLSFYADRLLFGQTTTPVTPLPFVAPQMGIPTSAFLTTTISRLILSYAQSGGLMSDVQQITQLPFSQKPTIDFAPMPPMVFAPTTITDGDGNVSVSLAAEAPVDGLDGMTTVLELVVSTPDSDAGPVDHVKWTIISPPKTSLVLPKLTADLISPFPSTVGFTSTTLLSGSPYGSYGVYRRRYPAIAMGQLASAPYRVNVTRVYGSL